MFERENTKLNWGGSDVEIRNPSANEVLDLIASFDDAESDRSKIDCMVDIISKLMVSPKMAPAEIKSQASLDQIKELFDVVTEASGLMGKSEAGEPLTS